MLLPVNFHVRNKSMMIKVYFLKIILKNSYKIQIEHS